jgi:hypothetical protein
MIPVIDEPMEGIAFDVQDHARRIGTILGQYVMSSFWDIITLQSAMPTRVAR